MPEALPKKDLAGLIVKYIPAISEPIQRDRKNKSTLSKCVAEITTKANRQISNKPSPKPSKPEVISKALAKATIINDATNKYPNPKSQIPMNGKFTK